MNGLSDSHGLVEDLLDDIGHASSWRWLQASTSLEDADFIEDEDDDDSIPMAAILSNSLLFFLMFGLCTTVQLDKLHHHLTNRRAILTGMAMQFLVMPLLGFLSVVLFRNSGLTEAMGMSLLVITSSPGGSFSNWWCSTFNAELALSMAMTSASSILSLALLPANLFLYTWLTYQVVDVNSDNLDKRHDEVNILQSIDFASIFISLGVLMAGVLLGLWAAPRSSPTFHQYAKGVANLSGLGLIFIAICLGTGNGGIGDNGSDNSQGLPWAFFVGVSFPCVIGLLLSNAASRMLSLSGPEGVSISIECVYQNTAIATSVAVTMFTDPTERAQALSVAFFYGCVEAAVVACYVVWAWKMGLTYAPRTDPFCDVVTRTYDAQGMTRDQQPTEGGDVHDEEHVGDERHQTEGKDDDLTDKSYPIPSEALVVPRCRCGTEATVTTNASSTSSSHPDMQPAETT
jgi:predicted Na+-dependent transporter